MLEPRYSSPAVGGSQTSRLLEAASSVHSNLDTAVDLSQKSAAPSDAIEDQEDSEDEAPLDLKVNNICQKILTRHFSLLSGNRRPVKK